MHHKTRPEGINFLTLGARCVLQTKVMPVGFLSCLLAPCDASSAPVENATTHDSDLESAAC